jgi:hypothetical protein
MTRTEARLADALQASAGQVRDDRLRPLTGPGTQPAPQSAPEPAPGPRLAWRGWLAPAAAAVSVVLIIGLVLAVTGGRHGGRGGPAAVTAGLPRYFAQFGAGNPGGTTVTIRSVSTGSVVASAPPPHRTGWAFRPYAMAAAPDGRTFYAAYITNAQYACSTCAVPQLRIYRVSAADPGLTMIKGGVIKVPLNALLGILGSMAVSPDGTKLALTVARPSHGTSAAGFLDKIVVVGLRTGGQAVWQGGLDRAGSTLVIPDVSWTPDGRSIVFLALWCGSAVSLDRCENESGPPAAYGRQVRSVPVASGGGLLSRGTGLLTPGGTVPVIVHALAGPRPGELTLVLLSGRTTTAGSWPDVTVERVTASSGSVLGTEYRLVTGPGGQSPRDITFAADASGQHQMLAYSVGGGWRIGWIGQGRLHRLPIRQPSPRFSITAW